MNHKRVQRLCRDEGLRVLKKAKKRSRVGRRHRRNQIAGHPPQPRMGHRLPVRPDHELSNPQAAQHHRRVHQGGLGHHVARSITSDATVEVLEAIVATRGAAPEFLRMDNGTELTASALRDWCRFSESGTVYINQASPWENPFIESLTASSETSCSTSKRSRRCSRLRYWPKTSESSTTHIDHTLHSVSSRRPSSSNGGAKTNPDSPRDWIRFQGQATYYISSLRIEF